MSDDTNTEVDDAELDVLLDKNIDDIEDLPSFDVPPKGTYVLLLNAGTKKINGAGYLTIDCEISGVVQLANMNDPSVAAPKEGDKFGLMFNLENEFGLGNMKKFLAPFAAKLGSNNIKELKNYIQNLVVSATVDHRVNKKDPANVQTYAILKNVVIQ